MVIKKGIAIVVRRESLEDFKEIARRVSNIDPTIGVVVYQEKILPKWIPKEFLNIPVLGIYMVNPPPKEYLYFSNNISVNPINKIDEFNIFVKTNIPCLPIEEFRFGMEPDPKIYGDYVVIKPALLNSTGLDINMLPVQRVCSLSLKNFPEAHLIKKDKYLIQKFIKTGECPTSRRVLIFLGEVLLSYKVELNNPYPEPSASIDELLSRSVASNLRGNRKLTLEKHDDSIELAKKVSNIFPQNPILGIDIVEDMITRELFVLEVNLGGNTWAFSNNPGENFRNNVGLENMLDQYNAWDKAALALLKKVNEL